MPPSLPISPALSEATPDSLTELFSRDPEHFSDQDIDRIVAELRQQRERFLQAEATGSRPPRQSKIKPPGPPVNPEDIEI